jgi:hypothetical protein
METKETEEEVVVVLPHYLFENWKHYLTYDHYIDWIKYEHSRKEFNSKEEIEKYILDKDWKRLHIV